MTLFGLLQKDNQRKIIDLAVHCKELDLQSAKNNSRAILIYPNQKETAQQIHKLFYEDGKFVVLLLASMMAGKTGTALQTALLACTNIDNSKIVPKDHVFFITGLSDNDWKIQMKDSLIRDFEPNVFHRGNLEDFKNRIWGLKNCLVIVDEAHFAATVGQTLDSFFEQLGFKDVEILREVNIKFLLISATPNHVGLFMNTWKDYGDRVLLKIPETYVGFTKMHAEGRLKPYKHLHVRKEVEELLDENAVHWDTPKYHFIRLISRGKYSQMARANIEQVAKERDWAVNFHDSIDRMEDIDKLLVNSPEKHTIIVIKNFFKASKRLSDKHIGFVHETPAKNKTDMSVAAQGLAGRMCGNDKQSGDQAPWIYHDVEALLKYEEFKEVNGDFNRLKNVKSGCVNISATGVIRTKESFNIRQIVEEEEREAKRLERSIYESFKYDRATMKDKLPSREYIEKFESDMLRFAKDPKTFKPTVGRVDGTFKRLVDLFVKDGRISQDWESWQGIINTPREFDNFKTATAEFFIYPESGGHSWRSKESFGKHLQYNPKTQNVRLAWYSD